MSEPFPQSPLVQELTAVLEARYQAEAEVAQAKQAMDLDSQADLAGDEPEDAKPLGDSKLESGKCQGMRMRDVYQLDKTYVTWVREHVTPASKKYTVKMVEFRLYIELRDLQKSKRL